MLSGKPQVKELDQLNKTKGECANRVETHTVLYHFAKFY